MEYNLPKKVYKQVLSSQKNEITEHYIYKNLSKKIKNHDNSLKLKTISEDELRHYRFWKSITHQEIKPSRLKMWFYTWVSMIFGLTFGVKLMERGEENAQFYYQHLSTYIPEAKEIADDEGRHEDELLDLIQNESLDFIGSIVLGMNDALVELTGTLAGLTFALQDTEIIGLAGLITGIAASFSMAASEYLSNRSEENSKSAIKSATYTGLAYIITVTLLIMPYFILENYMACLGLTLAIALFIIFCFNYYLAIAKNFSFKKRFIEMTAISMGVALLTFGIGFLIRKTLGVDI